MTLDILTKKNFEQNFLFILDESRDFCHSKQKLFQKFIIALRFFQIVDYGYVYMSSNVRIVSIDLCNGWRE